MAAAVGIGVALSLLLQINREALDLKVVQLEPLGDGHFTERPAPAELLSNQVTVLDVYGSLLYAGSRTLQARLPDPSRAERPVVVLRLRGRTALGSTFFVVASGYAAKLAERGGRLYISGADRELIDQMQRNGKIEVDGPVAVYEAGAVIGASTAMAANDARTWLIEHGAPRRPADGPGDSSGRRRPVGQLATGSPAVGEVGGEDGGPSSGPAPGRPVPGLGARAVPRGPASRRRAARSGRT